MKEALKLALHELEGIPVYRKYGVRISNAITAIKEALAQDEQSSSQEPVAYGMWDTMIGCGGRMMYVRLDKGQDGCTVPLYTTPPQRPWVGLTDENFQAIKGSLFRQDLWDGYGWDLALKEAIEAKLKEKNT